jgi:hypothetical protein
MKAIVLIPTVEEVDLRKFRADDEPDRTEGATLHFQPGRGVHYLWDLGDTDEEREGVRYAKLSTGHDKDRKRFYASLRNVVRFGGKTYRDGEPDRTRDDVRAGGYIMESTSLFDSVTVFSEAVARYSAKRMAEFDQRALAALRVAVADRHSDLVTEEQRAKVLTFFDEELFVTKVVGRVLESDPGESSLRFLQRAVGGDIEPVPLPGGFDGYADEDGKYRDGGLAPNPVATALRERALVELELVGLPGDYVAGNLVVTAGLDEEGDTVYLTDDLVELFVQDFGAGIVWEVPVLA